MIKNSLTENRDNLDAGEAGTTLMQMIEDSLDIKQRGFHLTFTDFIKARNLVAIYDSEWCRISFMLFRQRMAQDDELTIEYGRLHALNDQPYMEWQDEKCHCWHNIIDPLRFLDGLSPSEAMSQAKIQKQSPPIVENYRQSEIGKRLFDEYPPKSSIVMHSVLWKHYGQQLFELFDLRKPDLWEKYRKFIKEYYGLLGMKTSYGPPYENVC